MYYQKKGKLYEIVNTQLFFYTLAYLNYNCT